MPAKGNPEPPAAFKANEAVNAFEAVTAKEAVVAKLAVPNKDPVKSVIVALPITPRLPVILTDPVNT